MSVFYLFFQVESFPDIFVSNQNTLKWLKTYKLPKGKGALLLH